MAYTDLHSHVLPALDDGAADMNASRTILGGLAALGFTTVVCTPHQKAGQFMPAWEVVTAAFADTQAMLRAEAITLELALAAENMWDDVFYQRSADRQIPSYAGDRAFLVEFPLGPHLPVGVFETLFQLRTSGKLPVIAHPERYHQLWRQRDLVDRLAANCALVVDLGAVAGYHGRRRRKAARTMLEAGQAHAVASDAHSPSDVGLAAEGMEWIRKKFGIRTLDRLLDDNPAQILRGELPE